MGCSLHFCHPHTIAKSNHRSIQLVFFSSGTLFLLKRTRHTLTASGPQQRGRSGGGGGSFVSGVGPSSTANTMARPMERWESMWQCMNHIPAGTGRHSFVPCQHACTCVFRPPIVQKLCIEDKILEARKSIVTWQKSTILDLSNKEEKCNLKKRERKEMGLRLVHIIIRGPV